MQINLYLEDLIKEFHNIDSQPATLGSLKAPWLLFADNMLSQEASRDYKDAFQNANLLLFSAMKMVKFAWW